MKHSKAGRNCSSLGRRQPVPNTGNKESIHGYHSIPTRDACSGGMGRRKFIHKRKRMGRRTSVPATPSTRRQAGKPLFEQRIHPPLFSEDLSKQWLHPNHGEWQHNPTDRENEEQHY
jgi:hypothetical protein